MKYVLLLFAVVDGWTMAKEASHHAAAFVTSPICRQAKVPSRSIRARTILLETTDASSNQDVENEQSNNISSSSPKESQPSRWNFISRIKRRLTRRVEELASEAEDMDRLIEERFLQFSETLHHAIRNETEGASQDLALETVRFLMGNWTLSATTVTSCAEGFSSARQRIDNTADTAVFWKFVGGSLTKFIDGFDAARMEEEELDEETIRSKYKSDVESERPRFVLSVGSLQYPWPLKVDVLLTDTLVETMYGTLSIDLITKEVAFALDELIIFGTQIDLEGIIQEASAASEADATDTDVDLDADTDTDRQPSKWKRFWSRLSFRKKTEDNDWSENEKDSEDNAGKEVQGEMEPSEDKAA
mmetsp:Transcript_4074/g.8784  ORF Transcript_4074/g.8784 Transcript_4074/m.8784 type:complete len:360 (-) Transcript_4074:193-1272(-)